MAVDAAASVPGPPSRWPVITAFALVGTSTQLIWLNFAGVTTVAAERYDVSENAIGWLAQVFPLLYVVLAIPAGLILDRWFRSGLLAGAILTTVGAALRLVSDDYVWLLIGQLVASVAQPLVLNAITGITGRYLAEKDRPKGIAVGTASTFAGMVLAFVLSGVLPDGDQLPTLLTVSAAFAVLASAALAFALRKPGEHRVDRAGEAGALGVAWSDPLIRRLALLAIFPFGVFVAMTTFAQALLEPAGVSGGTASTILLVNVVAGVVACAIVPVIAVRHRAESSLIVTSLLVTALGCAILALAPGVLTGFVAITVIGFLLLPTLPVVLELVERRTGQAESTGAGLIWMAGNLGGLLTAVAVGLLVDRPALAFAVMAAVALVAVPGARSLRGMIGELGAVPSDVPEGPVKA